MADSTPTGEKPLASTPAKADVKVEIKPDVKPNAKPPKPPNPVWKMMGLPNLPKKLPSRNWLIFFSITGSFATAVIYDKREKKRAQRKWCKLVEHLATEPIGPKDMPRKFTVFLEGPPADSLRLGQDHFKDYVKPILVASGLDWDFVQGRKQGDVRAELAEIIRKRRTPKSEDFEDDDSTTRIRKTNGTRDFGGPQGDIVIGRHTWKEYIRGLHEGWLGPLTAPKQPSEEVPFENKPVNSENSTDEISMTSLLGDQKSDGDSSEAPTSETPLPQEPPKENEKDKKPKQPAPFISVAEYSSTATPLDIPASLDPSTPIPFPHILGIRYTPLRLYRFLNRRKLADNIGRDVAAIILANTRPYHEGPISSSIPPESAFAQDIPATSGSSPNPSASAAASEQNTTLFHEESEWHKSIRDPKDNPDNTERIWLNDMVLDPRIASRMRRAELSAEDEERARMIVVPEEEVEGFIKGSLRTMWRSGQEWVGKDRKPKGPNVGNVDEETV